jgi:predicted TIM-barrel fold metal-dependent hydrolase
MIIDAHVHVSENGKWFDTGLVATPAQLIEQLDLAAIERAVLLPTFNNCDNRTIFQICRQHPHRLIGFATVDVHNVSKALIQMQEAYECFNAQGMKLHPRFQRFKPLDRKFYPIYEKSAEYGWPIVFDGFLQSKDVPMEALLPTCYDILAKQFPALKIVIAHMGGHRFWDSFYIAKANTNVYMDISFVLSVFARLPHLLEELKFVIGECDQKIIYGSDFPEISLPDYLLFTQYLLKDFPPAKKENIFGGSFLRLMGSASRFESDHSIAGKPK